MKPVRQINGSFHLKVQLTVKSKKMLAKRRALKKRYVKMLRLGIIRLVLLLAKHLFKGD